MDPPVSITAPSLPTPASVFLLIPGVTPLSVPILRLVTQMHVQCPPPPPPLGSSDFASRFLSLVKKGWCREYRARTRLVTCTSISGRVNALPAATRCTAAGEPCEDIHQSCTYASRDLSTVERKRNSCPTPCATWKWPTPRRLSGLVGSAVGVAEYWATCFAPHQSLPLHIEYAIHPLEETRDTPGITQGSDTLLSSVDDETWSRWYPQSPNTKRYAGEATGSRASTRCASPKFDISTQGAGGAHA